MFYSDIRIEPLRQRVSRYILRFEFHYDEYENGRLVRTVDLTTITLQ